MKHQYKMAVLAALGTLSFSSLAAITDGRSYGDWKGTCQDNACGVTQVQNNDQGEPVGRVLLRRVPDENNSVVMFVTLPLGVNLKAGLALAVDNNELGVTYFDFCDPGGCNAAIPLPAADVNKIKAGNKMQVAAYVGGQQQTLEFSLRGVTDSINNL